MTDSSTVGPSQAGGSNDWPPNPDAQLMDLAGRVAGVLDRLALPPGTVLVAVSGGGDSIALLDLLANAGPSRGFDLRVVHFDHGIDPTSGAVADRVRQLADRYQLPFESAQGALGPGCSETVARTARMAWFTTLVAQFAPAVLMTAHQADDQLETQLMRFLKGSGPSGLSGMAERRGAFVRPLLSVSRAELAQYVSRLGVLPWVDPANSDVRHLRAWLRNSLVPTLERRLPRVRENLAVARGVFEENRLAWEALLDELPGLAYDLEPDGASVAAVSLAGYSSGVVRSLLRGLGRRADVQLGRRQLDRLQRLLEQGDTGQRVDLGVGASAELTFGRLRLFRRLAHPPAVVSIESSEGRLHLGDWVLDWTVDLAPERLERSAFSTWVTQIDGAQVRPWQPGDRVRPLRGSGTRLVVRCMQEAKVARSRRAGWPVIERLGEVIWIPGVCRGDGLVPIPGTPAVRLDVRPS